jgi:hypothetical protein
MGKLIAIIAVLGVMGVMGGLYFFLQWQEQQTRDQLAAAAEWLIQRNVRMPISGGWSVDNVKAGVNSIDIHLKVPEDQAKTILTKPEINRRASLRPGCPTPQEAIWHMLPTGATITVSAKSVTGRPLANAVCSGPS